MALLRASLLAVGGEEYWLSSRGLKVSRPMALDSNHNGWEGRSVWMGGLWTVDCCSRRALQMS